MGNPVDALGDRSGAHQVAPFLVVQKLVEVEQWLQANQQHKGAVHVLSSLQHAHNLIGACLEADPEPAAVQIDAAALALQTALDGMREDPYEQLQHAYPLCQEVLEDFCALARVGEVGVKGAALHTPSPDGKPPARRMDRQGRASI